jgi:hypothetical protein
VSPESSRGNSTVLMVGNDGHSWAVDGENYYTKHKRKDSGAKRGKTATSSASGATSTRCRCTSPSTGAFRRPTACF